jgi:hypothetical protein
MEEPQRPAETSTKKKIPSWAHEIIQDVENYGALDGYFKERKKPRPYSSYIALLCDIIDVEPTCYEEVGEKKVWKNAMIEEYQTIIKNDVQDVVLRLKNNSFVSSKWIYKKKHSTDGSIEKCKARFVDRGVSQKEGIYYEDTFSHVERYTSSRDILVIVAVMKWKVHHMDVKTTFLNGVVEEEVNMEQRQGFETHDRQTHVFRLKKSLYGLKQAPREWYNRIDRFMMSLGFTKNKADPNLYYKVEDSGPVIFLLYVDDLFLTGNENFIIECKRNLASEFKMKDLGMMHYFLGLDVAETRRNFP